MAKRLKYSEYVQLPLIAPESDWKPPTELPKLDGCRRICVDVETKDPYLIAKGSGYSIRHPDSYIVGIGIGTDDGRRVYLPIRHEGGDNLDEKNVIRWAKEELGGFRGEIVGAHLIYDVDHLLNEGIDITGAKLRDVQYADPLIDEHQHSYSLEAIAQRRLGEGKAEAGLKEAASAYGVDPKGGLWRLPARYVGPYAEGDVDLPLRILELQEVELRDLELEDLFHMECALIPILVAMVRRGVRIDVPRVERTRVKLVAARDAILDRLSGIAGHGIDVWATASFINVLRDRGLDVPTTTSGRSSVQAWWLEKNEDDPFCEDLLAARRLDKTITTFIDGHILGNQLNGRVHPEFHPLRGERGGTTSGRFASTFHNLPARDSEIAPLIRGCFVADEGEVWERDDYSQIEWRLLAHYAIGRGAKEAREAYRNDPDTDFHVMCGELAGLDTSSTSGRKKVKNVNFAVVYGAGVATTARTMGMSEEAAATFLDVYHDKLPFVRKTFRRAAGIAKNRGYIKTILKRRVRFPRGERCHKGLNSVLQGGNADFMKRGMVDIWEAGVCDVIGPPLLTVHDELDWSRPDTKEAREAAREAVYLMERAIELRVPVRVDRETGPDWGHCARLKRKETPRLRRVSDGAADKGKRYA